MKAWQELNVLNSRRCECRNTHKQKNNNNNNNKKNKVTNKIKKFKVNFRIKEIYTLGGAVFSTRKACKYIILSSVVQNPTELTSSIGTSAQFHLRAALLIEKVSNHCVILILFLY
jgi:hypothetical protein